MLKRAALWGLATRPVYSVLRRRAHRGDPITLLCYHTLRPMAEQLDAWTVLGVEAFLAQIAMLREDYDIITLDQALLERASGSRPRVVLTFDDGERGLYDHLLPVVEAENLPVTVYVATSQIETGVAYWFDRIMNALQVAGPLTIDLTPQGLSRWTVGPVRGKERWQQIGPILEAIKEQPTRQRDALADQVVGQVGSQATGFAPLEPMTLPQLQSLARHPMITIGAHSHGHELLDQLPLQDAETSIVRSRDLLTSWTGLPVHHFAYPNGNYTPELMNILQAQGFSSATILEDRLVFPEAPATALPRIGVGRYDHLDRLRLRLVGI